jgi:hypothetical protein
MTCPQGERKAGREKLDGGGRGINSPDIRKTSPNKRAQKKKIERDSFCYPFFNGI